ncbi:MAG: HU family DNA-binding protein [Spirochaetales bacterium]|nr:HU family DNA-binding protein [Spirochaetales bacterium]
MDESIQLPINIERHLRSVTESSGLPATEESFQKIVWNWYEKRGMFESQIKLLDMTEITSFDRDDPRAALLLTYSGSLISLGSLKEGKRWMEYASIKLRADVPDLVIIPETEIKDNIKTDQEAKFAGGPIKTTSAVLTIAVCPEDVSLDNQEKRIREATIFLTNGFTKVNRKISLDEENTPDQFNMKSIVNYVASKNTVTQKLVRQILDDYLVVLESGILLGSKVPLGRIGRLFLKKRAARKARVMKNIKTGKDITVSAKPEMFVPTIKFSSHMREKASITIVE